MNEFCSNCAICCELIPSVNGKIFRDDFRDLPDNLISLSLDEAMSINGEYVKKVQEIFPDAQFYKCPNLSGGKICSPIPEECALYPESPMSIVPDECYYAGEIFIKKEEIKHKIRKYKEEILYYQALINSGDKDKAAHEKIIRSLSRFVDKYKMFGSDIW